MIDYEETREDAMLSLEQQIKQLVKDAFDKGYQCGYKDRKTEPQTEVRAIEMLIRNCKSRHGGCKNCDMKCAWRGEPPSIIS